MSTRILNTLLFLFALIFLMAVLQSKTLSGFRGGEGIGGRTAGPAASTLSPADYEGFRGEAINGRTAGPAATTLTPAPLLQEGFSDFDVKGKSEVNPDSGPANAQLTQPRKPYHLLSDVLQNAPRDTIGCLRAGCCDETDFESRTNLTGNYLQRTNNYKRDYPDNCTGPLHEFTMSFYKTTPLSKQIA
jgi:hypothetical protein